MVDQDDIRPLGGGPQPTPPHAPPHQPHEGHIDADLPRIRTYAEDLSEEIKKKGSTLATIVGAERERAARELSLQTDEEPPKNKYRNPLLLVGAGALVVLGVGVIATALYLASTGASSTPPPTPSIIFPNKIVPLTVPEGRSIAETLGHERMSADLSLGEIERIDLTLTGATTSAQSILAGLNAPPALLREAKGVMVGVHSFDHTQPFIIITVTQYDRAFGAMLNWEEDIGRSMGGFFKPLNGTTPPTTLFSDMVFQNIDARVSQAGWPILYAFPRKDVLVITTNQYTLQEVLTRLNAQTTTTQ